MAVKLKFLLLLIALVALPLRGMAAVAAWHCAELQHERSESTGGHDDGHGTHAGHEGQAVADTGHSHDTAVHDEPAGSHGTPAASCSACAACCVGGAVAPAAWISFPPEPPGAGVIAFFERGFTGVVPAQLERPPLVRSL